MKKKNGFTLVELLAVIVVLAIIMIIVVPNVLRSLNGTKKESFYLYSQKLESKAVARYTQDLDLNKQNTECAVYDISKDLDLGNTGKYEGWVKILRVPVSSGKLVATANVKHEKLSGVYYCVTDKGTCNPNETYYFEENASEVNISKTVNSTDKLCYNYKYADENKVLKTSDTVCVSGKDSGTLDTYKYEVYVTLKDGDYKVENILINKDMNMDRFYENMVSKGDLSIVGPTCDETSGDVKGTTSVKTSKVTTTERKSVSTSKVTSNVTNDAKITKVTTTTTTDKTIEVSTQTTTTRQTYSIPTTTVAPENDKLLLNSLNVAGYDISFSPLKFSYEVRVANTVNSLSVSATPMNSGTTVTIIGNEGLQVGSNIIRINLSNPNESIDANYYIEVKKMDEAGKIVEVTRPNDAPIYNREEGQPDPTLPSSDASLSSIKVSGYTLDFDKNKYDYELDIIDTNTLPVQYYTTSKNARSYIEGNENLKDGSKISIYVTSENGYYKKVYTLTVHVKKESNIMSTFLKFVIAGLGVALVSLLIIISANKRASRRVVNKNDIINEDKNDEVK